MKQIITFILGLVMCISLISCATSSYADDDVDVNVVVSYGTPYYYPYYGNRWYYRHHPRPLPPRGYRPHYKPHPHMGGSRGFGHRR